jgi:hypothetical protein
LNWLITCATTPLLFALVQPPPPAEDTNIYYHVELTWSYPTPLLPGDFFYLYDGNQPWTFTNKTAIGSSTNYVIDRTNWAGTFDTHFYAVTLSRTNVESDFSGQVRYPLYPPDRVTVTWSGTNFTTLWSSTNLRQWSVAAMVGGTNTVTLNRLFNREFFRTSRNVSGTNIEPIRIKVWNPLNEPP